MPGLFGGIDDDTKLGLLTAALAAMSARGVRPGTALAQGGLLGIGAMQNAKAGREDERRKQMQEQLWQSQMAENLAQVEERRAKIAREQEAAQRQAQIAAGAPRVGVPEFNTGTPGYSSGVAQAYGVPEAKPADTKVDVYAQLARKAAYLADNNDVASAEKYVDLANKMKPKYSPTLSVVLDPATNKHILVQASETEMPRPVPGMLPERKVELKDFGGSLGAVDMRDLMPGASFPKTMTPEGRDSSARGWAEINDRRKRELGEGGAGKPQWNATTGQWVFPPSQDAPQGRAVSPEGLVTKQDRSEAAREDSAKTRADIVLSKVDESLKLIGDESLLRPRTGLAGSVVGMVPGTGAYDLRRTVETIKAQLGFGELQVMREISPTGGALGQVAVQELNMLQATIANLDPNQSPEQIAKNLQQVRTHMQKWRAAVRQAGGSTAGASGDFAEPAGAQGKHWVYNPKTGKLEPQ